MRLIQEAAKLEEGYEKSKLKFDVILHRTMKAVRHYLNKACNYNIRTYRNNAFRKLAHHMDVIDVGQFVPIIIMNASTHQALLSSQRLVQSWMPLSIAMALLMLYAQAVSGQMQFLSYISQRSVSLEKKVGPWPNVVPPTAPAPGTVASLESDSNPDKGCDPHKTTPAPEPMDIVGEPVLLSSKIQPVVKPKSKPKDPSKGEPKAKDPPKVEPKDQPLTKTKPEDGLTGEPSKPPLTPMPPADPPSQPQMTPTTAAIILARIKEKPGGIPAPPAPTYPGSSKMLMPILNGKSDPSKGLPSKRKKTSEPKAKGESTVEILSSSSNEGTTKSKSKSSGKRKQSSKKPKSAATVETKTSDEVVSPKTRDPLPLLALRKKIGHRANKWGEDLHAVIAYQGHRNIYP